MKTNISDNKEKHRRSKTRLSGFEKRRKIREAEETTAKIIIDYLESQKYEILLELITEKINNDKILKDLIKECGENSKEVLDRKKSLYAGFFSAENYRAIRWTCANLDLEALKFIKNLISDDDFNIGIHEDEGIAFTFLLRALDNRQDDNQYDQALSLEFFKIFLQYDPDFFKNIIIKDYHHNKTSEADFDLALKQLNNKNENIETVPTVFEPLPDSKKRKLDSRTDIDEERRKKRKISSSLNIDNKHTGSKTRISGFEKRKEQMLTDKVYAKIIIDHFKLQEYDLLGLWLTEKISDDRILKDLIKECGENSEEVLDHKKSLYAKILSAENYRAIEWACTNLNLEALKFIKNLISDDDFNIGIHENEGLAFKFMLMTLNILQKNGKYNQALSLEFFKIFLQFDPDFFTSLIMRDSYYRNKIIEADFNLALKQLNNKNENIEAVPIVSEPLPDSRKRKLDSRADIDEERRKKRKVSFNLNTDH